MGKNIIILLITFITSINSSEAQVNCKITYVANEGFIIQSGQNKIIVDGLFDGIPGNWCDSPSHQTLSLIREAKPPFNDVDLIAITHKHRDHYNEAVVVEYMQTNNKVFMICPKQLEAELSQNPEYNKFRNRVIALTPPVLGDTNIQIQNISIRILRLEHSHYMEEDTVSGEMVNRHRNIENLGYVFVINGLKFFHCGDTNPMNQEEYSIFELDKENLDLAFLERMFYSRGKTGIEIIDQFIKPKQIILMHINPANKSIFANHFQNMEHIHVFEKPMDSLILNFEN